MTPVAGALLVGLAAMVLYAVFGGADFGGGVWDLLANGPRRDAQRAAIGDAIGPVWESNHVWLIFLIVLLFTCFPPAFAEISVGCFVPLSLALVGIVLRGAAFVFRNYASDNAPLARSCTVVFGIASLLAPFFLGDAAGALATGRYAWTSPFALSVGVFAVTLCAQIAAVFLVHETGDRALKRDFRRRAMAATVAIWIVGLIPASMAALGERFLFTAFFAPRAAAAIVTAMVLGIIVIVLLARRGDNAARVAVSLETAAILGGWFAAQAPALIPGRYSYTQAAASEAMIVAFLIATAIGALFLIPSLVLLFAVFKGPRRAARERTAAD